MLGEQTRSRLILKIEQGENSLKELENQLEAKVSQFSWAAGVYGSELAGSDGADEIRKQIAVLRSNLNYLRKALDEKLDISGVGCDHRMARIVQIERAIDFLNRERTELNQINHEAQMVRGILDGTLSLAHE